MKQLLVVLGISLVLFACGGDDGSSTRDNIVSGLQANGLDADCVNGVLDGYSDEQLEAIDKTLEGDQSSADSDALLQKMLACVPAGT